jgi:hypothetical protein
VLALGALLVLSQPVTSPWWTYADADVSYLSAALSHFAGRPSDYFDHPGTPLEQLLAGALKIGWALSPDGRSAAEQADAWWLDPAAVAPLFRGLALAISALALVTVLAVYGRYMRHWAWGVLGAVLFLAAPRLILYLPQYRPELALAGIAVATVGLSAAALERRSAALHVAAAFLAGLALMVKVHAVGLAVPVAIAALLGAPPDGWGRRLAGQAAAFAHRRRAAVVAGATVWAGALVFFNWNGPPLDERYPGLLNKFALTVAGAAVLAAAAWLILRRTRTRRAAGLALALASAGAAGAIVPNLFFFSTLPASFRSVGANLTGGGVNQQVDAFAGLELGPLLPWVPLVLLAAIGFVQLRQAGDRTALVWATGAAALAVPATLRLGELRYFIPTVALLIPLALAIFGRTGRAPRLAPVALVAALAAYPIVDGVRLGDEYKRDIDYAQQIDRYVVDRLGEGEVALTTLRYNESVYVPFAEVYGRFEPPHAPLRSVPAVPYGVARAKADRLTPRYLVDPASAGRLLHDSLGPVRLRAIGIRADAREVSPFAGVYELRHVRFSDP